MLDELPRPLSLLLSQVLVAFTIEFDNEFEARLAKTDARPVKTSMVMWSNFMCYLDGGGITVGDLAQRSSLTVRSLGSLVGGMERWGYITVDQNLANGSRTRRKGFGSARGVKAGTIIRPTAVGETSREVWASLEAEIERRWEDRLGASRASRLRQSLRVVASRIEGALPRFLPVVGADEFFAAPTVDQRPGAAFDATSLTALLSRVLLGFALEYESDANVSLPVAANVLRVLGEEPARLGDVSIAAGISAEAVSMSLTWLGRHRYAVTEAAATGRGKQVRLTPTGQQAQAVYRRQLAKLEGLWDERHGAAIASLRGALEDVLDQPGGHQGPLSAGLVPPPGGWRGGGRYKTMTDRFVESPSQHLPHYPMVLHRGGWPDGS